MTTIVEATGHYTFAEAIVAGIVYAAIVRGFERGTIATTSIHSSANSTCWYVHDKAATLCGWRKAPWECSPYSMLKVLTV